jgi:hypothetical protein
MIAGATRKVLAPSISKNSDHHLQKRTVQSGDAFEDTAFKTGFEIVKF